MQENISAYANMLNGSKMFSVHLLVLARHKHATFVFACRRANRFTTLFVDVHRSCLHACTPLFDISYIFCFYSFEAPDASAVFIGYVEVVFDVETTFIVFEPADKRIAFEL